MLLPRRRSCPIPKETDRVRRIFEKQAPKYDRTMARFERWLFAGTREWACSRAHGDVLEIAAGTARNLPHYPKDARVTGVELSPAMAGLGLGRERASELGREIRSPNWLVRAIQRVIDPLAHRLGGDHLLREPLDSLAQEGFEVEELKREKAGYVELVSALKPA